MKTLPAQREAVQTPAVKTFAELLTERLALKVGSGLKFRNLRELAQASGAHFSTLSQCKKGLPPPLEHLSGIADALDFRGQERDEFIRAGKRDKALRQTEAAPYIETLEAELAAISRIALRVSGKLIDKGLKFDQETADLLRLIEKRL